MTQGRVVSLGVLVFDGGAVDEGARAPCSLRAIAS